MEHGKGQEQRHSQTVYWRIFIFFAILALTGLYCTSQLDAKVYKWIDENGVKHYSNTPPANARNVKIVFDEYQHDEVADQERVKNDQKEIDALIEKNAKEEQQASVEAQNKLMEEQEKLREEQKKIEEAKLNQPHWFAYGCFSPSYSIQQGRGVFEQIVPRDFIEGEYQDLQKLFKGFDGFWAGNAQVIQCKETDGEVREQMENYSIKSEGKFLSSGQFVLESDLYSQELKTSHNEILRLFLSEEKLASEPGIVDADIELIAVSSDAVIYVKKNQFRSGSGARRVREVVTTIKKTGEASFSLERVIYLNGKLVLKNTWHLESV
jgi:hypothetical protein